MSTLSASQGQHLLTGARADGGAMRDGTSLQRPQRARLLVVGIRLDQVGLAHVLDQHTPARGQRIGISNALSKARQRLQVDSADG